MKIIFTNGSILRLIGADAYDTSLVGTNAQMIVLSEAALMKLENVYAYARPILAANEGTILIFGTPRGKNAFWQLYKSALELPDWFVLKMGVDETQHISDDILEEERRQVSDEMFEQEWMVSFSKGVEGQIYGRELEKARLEERIGFFPHQPQMQTHLAIDIGVKDATTILWFQCPNDSGAITIIDSYSNNNLGIDHYAKIIQDKPYRMGKYFAPHDLAVREWMVSFSKGVEGQIYGRELEKARLEERIGFFPHQPQMQTHLAIDIGVKDATTILWFQCPNDSGAITIIDSYSNNNLGIDHYAKIIQDKPYRMGKYFAPHDLAVREWGGGAITRYEKARQLGIDFEILDQVEVADGIDNVKVTWPRIHIHAQKCKGFIDALENYRRVWNEDRQMYDDKPYHSWASNFADSLRYMCMALHKTQQGMSSAEYDRKRAEALYGGRGGLPRIFQFDPRYDR
jgi:hypothetical protein